LIALGYVGSTHVDLVRKGLADAHHYALLALAFAGIGYLTWRHLRKLRGRRPR
jgi:hypothetical protein